MQLDPRNFLQQIKQENKLTWLAYAIVNPATMPAEIRDDVCAQCHFLGDARVLRPGKNSLDFRPGTPLDKTVAILSVSAKVKGDRFTALDQFEQLRLSRCAIESKGRPSPDEHP